MSRDFTYALQVPRTSLRVTVGESLDAGDWDGDAAIVAAASAHSQAIYWTCFELLNRLGAALEPSARAAIEQQKRGA